MLPWLASSTCQWDWESYESPAPQGPQNSDLTLTFREECEGNAPDPRWWNTSFIAPDRTTAFRRYDWSGSAVADRNVSFQGGVCSLRIANEPTDGAKFGSATLDSTNKFEQKYGYFEVRAKVVRGKGLATTVSLADATRWPPQVNFVDVVGGDPKTNKFGGWFVPAGANDTTYAGNSVSTVDLAADFHTFGIDWTPTNVVFYLDGAAKGAVPQLASALTMPMRLQITPHAAIASGEQPDDTTVFPAVLQIDWIRVYQHRGL
ncbi:MAG: family 16 glycosylhydrolase [Deltaproteobacteria bacterium]|nr:family 16 glycosylhydrolase [Deltaproteobacteria bacterium]